MEWSQLKLGKTLKKSKILLMSTKFFAFFNKIFALFVPLIKVTFFPSLSYFTFVFKILRPYMPDLCILEKSGLQGFWSVKFTQRRKIKIGLHHFLETRDMSIHCCRSEKAPLIGRVDPFQLTDYFILSSI